MQEDFGRKMRAYRKLKHLTQKELADRLSISVSIIGGIERGNRTPTAELAQRIYEVIGLRID
ncbi:MAG: transcriptional regulator [Bacilli bacterium]|nr:transcriptional regulator [Bacilli bacterium]